MDYALSECFQFQVTENGTQINLNKKSNLLTQVEKTRGSALLLWADFCPQ